MFDPEIVFHSAPKASLPLRLNRRSASLLTLLAIHGVEPITLRSFNAIRGTESGVKAEPAAASLQTLLAMYGVEAIILRPFNAIRGTESGVKADDIGLRPSKPFELRQKNSYRRAMPL